MNLIYRLIIIFIFISPLWPTYFGIKLGSLPILNFNRAIGLILLIVFALNSITSKAWLSVAFSRLRPVSKPVMLLFIFFMWRFMSAFASKNIIYSLFLAAIDFLLQFLIFIAVVISFDDLKKIKNAFKIILISAVFVVLFGIIEHLCEKNIFVNLVPDSYRNVDFVASAIKDKVRDTYRVQGAFMHPLVLAEYLIVIIPIAGLFINDKQSILNRLFAFFVFTGGIIVLYSTGSRSGIVVFATQSLLFVLPLFLNRPKTNIDFIKAVLASAYFCITVICAGLYGKDIIIGRGSAEVMSTAARVLQLLNGVEAVVKKPILGYGQGLAADYIGVENIATGQLTVDNYYLTIAVESGIPSVIIFIMFISLFIKYSFNIHTMNALFNKNASNIFFCSVAGFAIFCLILSNYEAFGIIFSILGLMLVMRRITSDINSNTLKYGEE